MPESPFNDDQYRTVIRSEAPVKYPQLADEHPRVAFAIRAGALPLGTIWAIDASGEDPLTPEQHQLMLRASAIAAAHMLDDIRVREAGQAPREERLRTLLAGSAVIGTELAELGIPEERGAQLLAFDFSSSPIHFLGWTIFGGLQTLLFLAFFASFAVKMPMWPVHTWLPDAHVQAPTAGSVVLAAVLLKMGGYGFLRFSLPMFPVASDIFQPVIFWLSAIAIVYTSLVALVQSDMKKLIAYSSVAHMGYVTMGIFTANQIGVDGAIFQMLSHGFISGALFLLVGVIYDRMHTREIDAYGGLVNRMPKYALVFMFFTMANVGLPGTSGFVGEFLTLLGTFRENTWVATIATTGVILSAAYGLWLYCRVTLGALVKESLKSITDMTPRERWIFVPLIVMTLWLGIYPRAVTDITGPSVNALVTHVHAATEGMPEDPAAYRVVEATTGADTAAAAH